MYATGLALAAGWLAASVAFAEEYRTLRYDEDWTFLHDSPEARGLLDPLKYLPLDASGRLVPLARRRRAAQVRALLRAGAEPEPGRPERLPAAALPAFRGPPRDGVGATVRTAAELARELSRGRPRPTDRDDLDFHQLFIDVAPLTRMTRRSRSGSDARRCAYGSQRLISVRELARTTGSPSTRRVCSPASAIGASTHGRAPGRDRPGFFDDRQPRQPDLLGRLRDRPGPRRDRAVESTSTTSASTGASPSSRQEPRASNATRSAHGSSGSAAGFDWNFELVDQFGSFGGDSIRAWTIASDTGLHLCRCTARRHGCRARRRGERRSRRDRRWAPSTRCSRAAPTSTRRR